MYRLDAEEANAIRQMFVCMRDEYNWSANRPSVLDSRVVTKANEEYHGFQRLAGQYAASAMYKEAAMHFSEAASIRQEIIQTFPELSDKTHEYSITICKRLAYYYTALDKWQNGINKLDIRKVPKPEAYKLKQYIIKKLEIEGQAQLDEAQKKRELNCRV